MKNNIHKKAVGVALPLFIILCLGLVYMIYTQVTQKTETYNAQNSGTSEIKEERVGVRIATTTASGKKVVITFVRCATTDIISCFGHEAIYREEREGVLLYDRTSTDTHMYFGSISRRQDKWPYAIDIDFGKETYDEKDYVYFKNKIPMLFFENVKMSQ